MVVSQDILDAIKTAALAEFDPSSHIGFGSGTTTPSPLDTDLTTPIVRKPFDEVPVKNITNGTYDFATTLALTEGNGSNVSEVALFDALTAGTMFNKKLLSYVIAKDATKEFSVGMRVTIEVTNS